jgi:uncharacterized protein YqhQ
MNERLPLYGGQAVIEGVLMRGTRYVAMAMRTPDGQIAMHQETLGGLYASSWMKTPFLRGLVGLWDALVIGIRFLTISANAQTGEDEKLEGPKLYLTLGASLLIGIGVFFLAPAALGQWTESLFGWNAFTSNIVEGIVRLLLLVLYIWLIGYMPDVRRVFEYHGAEHKTINAFESGSELTPEKVAGYSLEHPRCGTSFLLTLVIFSIIIFAMLGPLSPALRISSRIVLLPLIASLAYEYNRYSARHLKNPLIRWLIKPNLALQHLTTREPDQKQLEVAITAFNTMYEQEKLHNTIAVP